MLGRIPKCFGALTGLSSYMPKDKAQDSEGMLIVLIIVKQNIENKLIKDTFGDKLTLTKDVMIEVMENKHSFWDTETIVFTIENIETMYFDFLSFIQNKRLPDIELLSACVSQVLSTGGDTLQSDPKGLN